MKLLFIGDIVGRPGRDLVRKHVRPLAAAHAVDLVIANGEENAVGGAGITRDNTNEILGAGVDVITTGNHVWDKRETLAFIGAEPRLIWPANYPEGTPGPGSYVAVARNGVRVGVINVMGRVFLHSLDDPFRTAVREIARVKNEGAQVVFVDMHAEASSEKAALARYLDGHVTAVIGSHTHVQTADERILPGGRPSHRRRHDGPARRHHRHGQDGRRSRASSPACPAASNRPAVTAACTGSSSSSIRPPARPAPSNASRSRNNSFRPSPIAQRQPTHHEHAAV